MLARWVVLEMQSYRHLIWIDCQQVVFGSQSVMCTTGCVLHRGQVL